LRAHRDAPGLGLGQPVHGEEATCLSSGVYNNPVRACR
jgi:hypothetical protein